MGTFTGGGPAISQEDRSVYQANALSKSLPGDISKSSDSFHSDYANPAYETGRNSNGVTLESSLNNLAENWTTDSGKRIIAEMRNLNADINSSLQSMKSTLLDVTGVTVEITYEGRWERI